MSRRGDIQRVRHELLAIAPVVRSYVPYHFDRVLAKAAGASCPCCHRPCQRLEVRPKECKGVTDVLLCASCEHFSVYRERAA